MRWRRIALAVGCFAFVGLALDIGLSLTVLSDDLLFGRPVPPFDRVRLDGSQSWIDSQRSALEDPGRRRETGAFDPELGWTVVPNGRRSRVTINAIGARSTREYERRPPPDVLRIVTSGESFTYCAEVADEETWQSQLEALRPDFEVLNFGVVAYGTDQALLRFRRDGLGLGADLLCVGLLLENIGRNVNRFKPMWNPRTCAPCAKPRFVLTSGGLELVPMPFSSRKELIEALDDGSIGGRLREHEYWSDPPLPELFWSSSFVRLAVGLRESGRRTHREVWLDEGGEPFRVTLALLEAFQREALADGTREMLVLIFPLRKDLVGLDPDGHRYWEVLMEALDERGIPYLDLSRPLLEGIGESGRTSDLYSGSHLNPLGNAIVARALGEWVEQQPALHPPFERSRSSLSEEEDGRE